MDIVTLSGDGMVNMAVCEAELVGGRLHQADERREKTGRG